MEGKTLTSEYNRMGKAIKAPPGKISPKLNFPIYFVSVEFSPKILSLINSPLN